MPFLTKKVPKLFSNTKNKNRRWSTNEANVHNTGRRKTMGRQIQLFRQLSLVLENKKSMAQNAELATAAAAAAISMAEDDEEREHDSRRGGLFGMPSIKKFGSSRRLVVSKDEQEPPTITTTTTRTDKRLSAAEELSEEDDSTFESSPTPTPKHDTRETVETDAMSLPDVPKLNFPAHTEDQAHPASLHNRCAMGGPSKRLQRRQRHSVSDMRTSELLKPSSKHRRKHNKPPFLNEYDDEGEYQEYINRIRGYDDMPPPVDSVSFSSSVVPPLAKISPASKTTRGYSWPAAEWDDETIESFTRDETEGSIETLSTMKPWIDRAAKLALLQNKANQHDRHNGQANNTMDYDYDYLDRRRLTIAKWEASDASASAMVALPRFRPGMDCSHPTRALLASEGQQQRRHRHPQHKRHTPATSPQGPSKPPREKTASSSSSKNNETE